jgi:hypothetical protein
MFAQVLCQTTNTLTLGERMKIGLCIINAQGLRKNKLQN